MNLATMIVSAMAAYVVNKYDFALKNVIYIVSIFIMKIPTTGSIATTYKLMNDLGLAGHRYGLIILAASGFGFNFFMIYSAFANLAWSYAESAMIDGAGHMKVFFNIMLPLIKPVLFSVGLIAFIGLWNDYYSPYMYMREEPTLAVGIYLMSFNITNGENAYDYPGLFALMMMATIPIIVVFSIFQKTIMANTVAGGIKG
ncbi:MAG: carbohydrate ABC transporter permease [Christensenellaceae bacterium]|nr:carbohydrate ABC transporter permease [Christensenellaceae bacterium]